MTASVTFCPRNFSASSLSFMSTLAEISSGRTPLPSHSMRHPPSGPSVTLNEIFLSSSVTSENLRPMNRFAEEIVLAGFVTAWRRAGIPTMVSPFLSATTDGVVRPPSLLGMTLACPPSMKATHELVVPRSIPMIFHIVIKVIRYKLWVINEEHLDPSLRGRPFRSEVENGSTLGVRSNPCSDARTWEHFISLWE